MRKIVLFTVAAAALAGCTAPAATPEVPLSEAPSIDSGLGTKDASADVAVLDTSREFGMLRVDLSVLNHSTETSDYFITVAAESKDGTKQYDTSMAVVQRLRPKQMANTGTVFLKKVPGGARIVVIEVQRTASN